MLNTLRLDFYKLFKSRAMIAVLVICALLTLVNPIWLYTDTGYYTCVANNTFNDSAIDIIVIIFVSVYFALDFSSGFIKNIPTRKKVSYLFSKAVCLVTVICILCLIKLVIHTISGLIYSAKLEIKYSTDDEFFFGNINKNSYVAPDKFTVATLLWIFNLFAIGMVVLAFATVCRNAIAIGIAPLAYMFLGDLMKSGLDGLFGLDTSTISKYTVFGCTRDLTNYVRGQSPKVWIIILVASTIGIVCAFLIGWLALRKRDVR